MASGRGGGGFPLFATALGLIIALAYAGLFTQAFSIIADTVGTAGQVAALALVAGTISFASLAARAASNDAVRAGTGENEFLLVRPIQLSGLVAARGLADAVTDPVGGLFLLPVLVAAAIVWGAKGAALPIVAASSMLAQIGISMLAYATQIGVVRYVPAVRRRVVWMALRLVAALALAALWMVGTWVVRAPAALATGLVAIESWVNWTPGFWIVAPLAALVRGDVSGTALAVGALGIGAAGTLVMAAAIATRAGMRGCETGRDRRNP